MSSAVELKGWKDLEVRCDNLPGKIREALKDAITSTVSDFAVDLATGPLSGGSLDVRTGKTRRAVKAVVSDKQASITGAVWIRSNAAFVTLIGQQHETKQHLRRAPSADLKKKHFGRIKRYGKEGGLKKAIALGRLVPVQQHARPNAEASDPFMERTWNLKKTAFGNRVRNSLSEVINNAMNAGAVSDGGGI